MPGVKQTLNRADAKAPKFASQAVKGGVAKGIVGAQADTLAHETKQDSQQQLAAWEIAADHDQLWLLPA
jgi:hypothetical protein